VGSGWGRPSSSSQRTMPSPAAMTMASPRGIIIPAPLLHPYGRKQPQLSSTQLAQPPTQPPTQPTGQKHRPQSPPRRPRAACLTVEDPEAAGDGISGDGLEIDDDGRSDDLVAAVVAQSVTASLAAQPPAKAAPFASARGRHDGIAASMYVRPAMCAGILTPTSRPQSAVVKGREGVSLYARWTGTTDWLPPPKQTRSRAPSPPPTSTGPSAAGPSAGVWVGSFAYGSAINVLPHGTYMRSTDVKGYLSARWESTSLLTTPPPAAYLSTATQSLSMVQSTSVDLDGAPLLCEHGSASQIYSGAAAVEAHHQHPQQFQHQTYVSPAHEAHTEHGLRPLAPPSYTHHGMPAPRERRRADPARRIYEYNATPTTTAYVLAQAQAHAAQCAAVHAPKDGLPSGRLALGAARSARSATHRRPTYGPASF